MKDNLKEVEEVQVRRR